MNCLDTSVALGHLPVEDRRLVSRETARGLEGLAQWPMQALQGLAVHTVRLITVAAGW